MYFLKGVLIFGAVFTVHNKDGWDRVLFLYTYKCRTITCIAMFLNSACAVAVVDSKVTEVRGNFVEDECYQMATEFQERSLRPNISVTCT